MVQSKRIIDWQEYQQLLDNLVANIGDDKPDCIVGLTRGGVVPAVHLSHTFHVPLFVVNVSLRDGMVGKDYFDWNGLNMYGRVLIVDDINDRGYTLSYVDGLCSELKIRPKTAVLLSKASSAFQVSFSGEVINKEKDDEWIVFPWEQEEWNG